jgi:hypothetical protein
MAAINQNIFAGISGALGGASMAFFGQENTPLPVATVGTAGVQTVAITGVPTSGTFTLTYAGATTAPLPIASTASAVQAALLALPPSTGLVLPGDVIVTGGPGPSTAWVATFAADLNPANLLTATGSFTGGTTPTITVTETTPGVQATSPGTGIIPATFSDAGFCSQTGMQALIQETSNLVPAFGTTSAVRTIVSQAVREFQIGFMESNVTTLALAFRKPLGSITPDYSGAMQIDEGRVALPRYATVLDFSDGQNHLRVYAPSVSVTKLPTINVESAKITDYPLTFTAYPDSTGRSVSWYYQMSALAIS